MNFMALHDGNRLPRHAHWENFKPRAKIFLDQLQAFMRDIERSGRKVMLIVVPEHGAAVRGDRVQTARLRDIPSMRITQVPTMVKFFGLKELNSKTVHVTGDTSYLALGALIGKVLETNFYSSPRARWTLRNWLQNCRRPIPSRKTPSRLFLPIRAATT